jgi:hypothetical protein
VETAGLEGSFWKELGMRRRMWIIGVLAGVLTLTATAAQAVLPGQVGRVDRTAYQLGNPALGAVHVAVAGELVNTDADADADALRGAVRISKLLFALRVQTQAELHRIEGGAWHFVARGPVVNSGTASNALSKTPLIQFCDVVPTPPTQTERTYRVVSRNSVRWSNTGRLSNFNVPTLRFVAPILLNDPACIQPG